jgi:molybdopterin-guanine dinucleotide biosynthesis protein A
MSENNQTKSKKSNGRGGARANAGRKQGAATKKTREIADKAAAQGITPLEVMLEAMNKLRAGGELEKAAAVAKDAAPYVHPKLASVEMNAKVQTRSLDEELAELNAIHNAAGDSQVA